MLRHGSEEWTDTGALRGALARGYEVLQERDHELQLALVARHLDELLQPSVVRNIDMHAGVAVPVDAGNALPASALAMEAALVPRALAAERSLLSSHPLLDPDLAELNSSCRVDDSVVHVLLVRAQQKTHGVFAVHWVGRDRPEFERRFAFYYYWDLIGLAVAAAREKRRIDAEIAALRRTAYTDPLTGLPNAVAFEQRLREHAETEPLSVVVLDFDGMREANTALGWVTGGDALIAAVGHALAHLARPGEFPARLHTAGDEFALLLPGTDEREVELRAAAIEAALDGLSLSDDLRAVYRGASVGHATRRSPETPGQALSRAVGAMRERKSLRAKNRSS